MAEAAEHLAGADGVGDAVGDELGVGDGSTTAAAGTKPAAETAVIAAATPKTARLKLNIIFKLAQAGP